MIRILSALVLALHGLIHVVGFVSPWRIATLEGFTYRTTVLNGSIEIGDLDRRIVGLAWLGLTIGFLGAGFGVWRGKPWAVGLAGALAMISLIVCVVGLPETVAGIAIDVAILAGIGYMSFRHEPRKVNAPGSSVRRPS